MKNVIVAVTMLALAGAAKAEPLTMIGAGIVNLSPFILGTFVGNDATKPVPACYSEPSRKVAWKNNPDGYSFTVAGCDYASKADQLVLVK
jgi:hypothetical protein